MRLIELLAALSIYPWNLGAGGYYTYGTFRDDLVYHGQSAIVTLDRKNKDLLEFKFEDFTIDGDGRSFEQTNYIARAAWWADKRCRPGAFLWIPHTDFKSDEYYLGGTLEGDFSFGGYRLAMTHKHGQDFGTFGPVQRFDAKQYDVSLHKWFGPHRFQVGVTHVSLNEENYYLLRLATLSLLSNQTVVFLEYSTGESRYYVEPFDLAVHDSEEILKAQYVAGFTYRFFTNLSGYASYIRVDMESAFPGFMWPETKQYYTVGLQVRI